MAAKEKSITITFKQDCVVKDHDGEVVQEFKEGKTATLSVSSANHWLSRNKAVEGKAVPDAAVKSASDEVKTDDANTGDGAS